MHVRTVYHTKGKPLVILLSCHSRHPVPVLLDRSVANLPTHTPPSPTPPHVTLPDAFRTWGKKHDGQVTVRTCLRGMQEASNDATKLVPHTMPVASGT